MRALAVLVFVLISSTSFAATSERFSKGGWYKDFQPEIERATATGELFRIKGHCQSNCTLFAQRLRRAQRHAVVPRRPRSPAQYPCGPYTADAERLQCETAQVSRRQSLHGDAGVSHHSGQHDHRYVRLPGMSAPVEAHRNGQPASHFTGRLSNPRNAQPPIRTGSLSSSRRPFSRANALGSATSATMAREANAPAQ